MQRHRAKRLLERSQQGESIIHPHRQTGGPNERNNHRGRMLRAVRCWRACVLGIRVLLIIAQLMSARLKKSDGDDAFLFRRPLQSGQ